MAWNRRTWVSLSPTGIRETKPANTAVARIVWDNRPELPFAWRILTPGVYARVRVEK